MLSQFYEFASPSYDPYYNLAVEEHMVNHIQPGQMVLYYYQNAHTIVIGKNQNPWRECKSDLFEKDGGKLARRISGGGAVYHDLGNLNFSFITTRQDYDIPRQLSVITAAMQSLGLNAQPSGRNDITIDGKKFSGNAFCYRKQGAFHHGTLLVSTDMTQLSRYLTVSPDKIKSKGVSSVSSRVVNLVDVRPGLTVAQVRAAVSQAFAEIYGPTQPYPFHGEAQREITDLTLRNGSFAWKYGESPAFDIEFETRFAWGNVFFGLQVDGALIRSAKVYSDALNTQLIDDVAEALSGVPFASDKMAQAVLSLPVAADTSLMQQDIVRFLLSKGF